MNLQTINTCKVESYEKLPPDEEFINQFENRVKETIEKYKLINKKDKILVAVSGGKDSTTLLYILKKFRYDIEAITIDVHIGCYTKKNLQNIQTFCDKLGVKLHVFEFRKNYGYSVCYITSVLQEKGNKLGTCTVCGVLRRKLLNQTAREIGANAIAFGHNMDDEAHTFLMNIIKNRHTLNARIGPKPGAHSDDRFVQRVKPLYFCTEEDVAKYSKMHGFPVQYGRCPCSPESTRGRIRTFMSEVQKIYPNATENLLKYLIKIQPKLKVQEKEIQHCIKCKEPTSGQICRTCDILTKLKEAEPQPEPEDFTLKKGMIYEEEEHLL